MLSSMTRLKLAILLDPWREGQDWSALAERIGLVHLVPAFKAMSSPTKDLLSFYEVRGWEGEGGSNRGRVMVTVTVGG